MKKLLLAFAIIGFVACNNETEKKEGADTTTVVAPAVDTTAPVAVDTTKKDSAAAPVVADTTKK